MSKKGILIIGAGGVSQVATVKCAMNIDTFEKITGYRLGEYKNYRKI